VENFVKLVLMPTLVTLVSITTIYGIPNVEPIVQMVPLLLEKSVIHVTLMLTVKNVPTTKLVLHVHKDLFYIMENVLKLVQIKLIT